MSKKNTLFNFNWINLSYSNFNIVDRRFHSIMLIDFIKYIQPNHVDTETRIYNYKKSCQKEPNHWKFSNICWDTPIISALEKQGQTNNYVKFPFFVQMTILYPFALSKFQQRNNNKRQRNYLKNVEQIDDVWDVSRIYNDKTRYQGDEPGQQYSNSSWKFNTENSIH